MKRLYKALLYSISGIKLAFTEEKAFRLEVIFAFIMIPAAFIFAQDKLSLILLVSSVLLVLIVELLNTAVEAAINRIGPEIHPLAKKAKDTGSAAVLMALLNAGLIWMVILLYPGK